MILKFILLLLEMKKQANFFIRSLSIHLLKILHSEDKKKPVLPLIFLWLQYEAGRNFSMKKHVVDIGGGPAGMTAAIFAARAGATVTLLEKGTSLGRKLLLTGGGRCNITNHKLPNELITQIPGNGKFLYSALSQFGAQDIIHFFHKAGIELKEEAHGRMFPKDDQATSILQGFLFHLKKNHVQIQTNCAVQTIHFLAKNGWHHVECIDGKIMQANAVILATGGQTLPKTGSSGDGYPWAKLAGHTITNLYPTEVPLQVSKNFMNLNRVQGLTFPDTSITVINSKGKAIKEIRHDLLFTHFGLSGPAALRAATYVQALRQKRDSEKSVSLQLDVCPDSYETELYQKLLTLKKQSPQKSLKSTVGMFTQERYALFLLDFLKISNTLKLAECKNETLQKFIHALKAFLIPIDKTLGFEKAFVTGGGVSVKEINPKTMASKKMPGLYFCGELLDIHAHTGGYNLTAAMSTGFCAGNHAGT